MKSRRDTPAAVLPAQRNTSPEDGPDEPTDERTIEWDVEQMGDDLLEVAGHTPAEETGHAIVADAVEDESAAAKSPAELQVRRARRDTVPSVVSSMLAKSMRPAVEGARPREPGAPAVERHEITRRVVDSDRRGIPIERHGSSSYSIELVTSGAVDVHTAPTAERPIPQLGPVARLVDKARCCLDAGDVAAAVITAAQAIALDEASAEAEVANLTDTASGPLARIFTAGPISKVPVLNRSDAEMDTLAVDELHWALLRRLDGQITLDEIFRATKIPAVDALRIAAALLRDGVLRIDDRAHSGGAAARAADHWAPTSPRIRG
jgi:hypothetical protein